MNDVCRILRIHIWTNRVRCGLLFGLVGFVLFQSGCATHTDKAVAIRAAYFNGDLPLAMSRTEGKAARGHDENVVLLDRAMLQLSSGEPQQAEQLLRQMRDRFDQLEDRSYTDKVKSMLTDDRQRNYAGEEYERILIRVMLALSNLMHDGGDVPAYALQITDKQQQFLQTAQQKSEDPAQPIIDYTPLTKQLAIGSYLRASLLESSPLDFDDVTRCRVQVANWQPDFRDARIDLARAESGLHSTSGNGVVYVIALVGEGPYKEQVAEMPTTVSLLIADRILSALGKYELPPTVAPVKIPVVVRPTQSIEAVSVRADTGSAGSTATIMNVSELAVEQSRLERNQVIARAVTRRIVKKAAVLAAKDGLNVENSPELDLLLTVAGVAWEATEQADTRCWSVLPDRIQVLRMELPTGSHALQLTPQMTHGGSGQPAAVNVEVANGRSTFVLANFPRNRVVGPVQTRIYR